jgi:hypothetical protein
MLFSAQKYKLNGYFGLVWALAAEIKPAHTDNHLTPLISRTMTFEKASKIENGCLYLFAGTLSGESGGKRLNVEADWPMLRSIRS